MKELKKALRDKSTNHLVVAILVGFGTVNFVQYVVSSWNLGPGTFWHGQLWRSIITYVIILIVAESVGWLAK